MERKSNYKMEIIPNVKWKIEIKVQLLTNGNERINYIDENPIRKWK